MLFNSTMTEQCIKMSPYAKLTQAGVDISVKKVEKIITGGFVYCDKTEILPSSYVEISTSKLGNHNDGWKVGWYLENGAYAITFNEGIVVPSTAQAKITHRSSIWRMGNMIESPWWDAGFECDNMNTTLIVNNRMFVEQNARLAQVVFWEMYPPKTLYNGQFQGLSSAYFKDKEEE